jgi:hypothetical protein
MHLGNEQIPMGKDNNDIPRQDVEEALTEIF